MLKPLEDNEKIYKLETTEITDFLAFEKSRFYLHLTTYILYFTQNCPKTPGEKYQIKIRLHFNTCTINVWIKYIIGICKTQQEIE